MKKIKRFEDRLKVCRKNPSRNQEDCLFVCQKNPFRYTFPIKIIPVIRQILDVLFLRITDIDYSDYLRRFRPANFNSLRNFLTSFFPTMNKTFIQFGLNTMKLEIADDGVNIMHNRMFNGFYSQIFFAEPLTKVAVTLLLVVLLYSIY